MGIQKDWTRLVGGISNEYGKSIGISSDGSIYLAGTTWGNLDGQIGIGASDIFLSKFNSDGSKEWTKTIGSPMSESQPSISVASDGFIYLAGTTDGIFDGQLKPGGTDAFVTKFNTNGIKEWTKLIGSDGGEEVHAISTSIDGSIYLVGDTGFGVRILDGQTNQGNYDAFISKFSSDGRKEWTRLLGTSSHDSAQSVAATRDGDIYVSGITFGNLDGEINNGQGDVYITKFNSNGTKIWTRLIGSNKEDRITSIKSGRDGSIYFTGSTEGNLDGKANRSTTTTGQTGQGGSDAFVGKFNSDGSKAWIYLLGSNGWFDLGLSIDISIEGTIHAIGRTDGNLDGNINNENNIYLCSFSDNGILKSTLLLGPRKEFSEILVTGNSLYLAGTSYFNVDNQINSGIGDAMVAKYLLTPYIITPSASAINEGSTLTTTVATTDVASGTTLYYSLSGTGITTSDFSSGALTDSGKVSSSGSFSFSHTLANDLTTEGTETLNIKLFSDSSLLTQVGSTASVSIADTSITPVIKNTGTAGFSISGKGDVGSQLSIIKTKDDPEGNGKFTYKWQSSVDGTNWTNLASTSSSHTIAATDASKQLRASISYLDGKSNSESVDTSALSVAAVASSKITAGDFATPANINLSLPAYVMSTNWNIDKYYYYVEQYPMTLRTAFYADYLAGRFTNQALYGQNHYLTGGQAEGRSLPGTDGILPDSNDYGAYVENYGITLLDIYRVDKRAVVNGGTMSLFAWGKEHYTNWGKAEGREISGGVEWGGIVRNNLDLYNQWQDARIVNPTLSAFAFGFQRQNTIKSTLGVLVGSDTADKLTGQIAYGLNGNDVICSDGGRGILAGGFGDDLLVAANGGSDLAYGGPGSDIFQLNAGSSFNIRDFRKGADMIQLGSALTSSGVTMQWDSADNSTLFYNGSSIIGKVYGKRPTEFNYSDSTNGVSKVYI